MSHVPALRAALAVLGGILLQAAAGFPLIGWWGLLAGAMALVFAVPLRQAALYLALFAIGGLRFSTGTVEDHWYPFPRAPVVLEGQILDATPGPDFAEFLVVSRQAEIAPGIPAPPRFLLRVRRPGALPQRGDRIQVMGRLRNAPRARNPMEPDWRLADRLRGVQAMMTVQSAQVRVVQRPDATFGLWLDRGRRSLLRQADHLFTGDRFALTAGMVLGQRRFLGPDLREGFAATGMAHLLAVSGLHVGFVIYLLGMSLSLLRIPANYRLLLVIPAVILYAVLTGASPPVVRAAQMGCFALFGHAVQRRVSPVNVLGAAALLMMLYDPADVFDVGFHLSFITFAGILVAHRLTADLPMAFGSRSRRWFPWCRRWILIPGMYSLVIAVLSAPVIGYYFSRIPLLAIFLNILLIPAAGLFVAFGWLSLGLSFLSIATAQVLAGAVDLLGSGILLSVDVLARLEGTGIPVSHAGLLGMTLALLSLWFLLQGGRRPVVFRACLVFLVAANALLWRDVASGRGRLTATCLYVGQGDATLLTLPDGDRWLIDAGDAVTGARAVHDYLHRAGIGRLETLVLTHPDADHIGGVPEGLSDVSIGQVLTSGRTADTEVFDHTVTFLRERAVPVTTVRPGILAGVGRGYRLYALGPVPGMATGNDHSVVLLAVFGDIRMLFTGDIEVAGERALLAYGTLLDSDLLRVAHHGSRTSSSAAFLQAVTPRMAVISVGDGNRYGHPAPAVSRRLEALPATVHRTDRDGAAIFTTDGRSLRQL